MNFILFYKLNFSVNSAVKGKISSKRCYLFGVFIVDFYGKQITASEMQERCYVKRKCRIAAFMCSDGNSSI